ncbi:MAG: hypothetical protein KME04_09215 [Pleurocapsa minor GSE-CHR-MK-17-07R]|jgi:hypothetical protein|nr:hypothetical protein [Pleurocapsa minor GSE-CHR-MK 17-07R]
MPLIVIFIFGAIILGAGAMLAPAWPSKQPRIGLNAALALALVVTGALFWAFLFGWNTLVIDYLMFALVTIIFLFGTLSLGQARAEKRGEELLDADQGWPGPYDLLFFGFAALLFIAPVLMVPVPLDTDAQGFGYLALMAREGGNFTTLAPFHPEVSYLYSPGFIGLAAYISQQLNQGLHDVQFGISAVLCLMFVWLAYDFGAEIQDKRLGRAMAAAALVGIGLFTAFMDSHFTSVMALNFALAFLILVYRYLRDGLLVDAVGAGLMFGSTAITHPDTMIILLLGFTPWLGSMWLSAQRPTLKRWLMVALGVPVIGVLGVSPWLFTIRDLLGSGIESPFERSVNYALVMLTFHGGVIAIFALIGAVIRVRQRHTIALLAVGWLIFALDAAAFGILNAVLGWLLEPILRYEYPFSIAWHAPIIPYMLLGGFGLLWLYDTVIVPRPALQQTIRRALPALMGLGGVALIGAIVFAPTVLSVSKNLVGFYGAFSSEADVQAFEWLRANTPEDARVLNYSAPHEADWAPVIAERDTIFYRPQPFFAGDEASLAEQERLRAFWQDPANPANEALLREANVSYVVVPQIVANPDAFATMWRWRGPFLEETVSSVADAAYLTQVFDADGAAVYQLAQASE